MNYRHWIALAWTLGILAACSIPGRDLPQVNIVSFDKMAHAVVFFGFGWLWMWALNKPLRLRSLWVLGSGVTYAILTEFYQGLLPFDRTPDPLDALANTAGLIAAIWLYRIRYGTTHP